MPHYNLTIITSEASDNTLIHALEKQYNILIVDKKKHFRNTIKTADGYLVVLYKEKKNVEISTDLLINL